MRKDLINFNRNIISWIVIFALLINLTPINAIAAQNVSDNQNERLYICDGYSVTFTIDTVWNSGYNVSVVIENTGETTISDWYMYLMYDGDIPNMWNASIYEMISPYIVLTNATWNKDIYSGNAVSFGFTGNGEFPGFPENVKISSGYNPEVIIGLGNENVDDDEDASNDGTDTDGDGLSDDFECAIGSNPEIIDTDGDDLSDYQEVYLTLTDPILTDTDGDGIKDAIDDEDGDGLTNIEEINRGTDVMHPDSDRDDLNDYDEVYTYGCDPLNPYTDEDELCDGDDVLLGFSPLMGDTDHNGILDSSERIYQTTENDFEYEDAHGLTSVSISLNVSGNADKEIEITNLYDFDAQSREVVGLIGSPIEITSDVDFDTATISFSYDESALGDTLEENLSLMWYDEENHWYQILDQDCVVDTTNNTVSYITTHFSIYFLVDIVKWFEAWNVDIEYSDDATTDITYNPTRYLVIEDTYSYLSTDDSKLIEEIKNTLSDFSNTFSLSDEGNIKMQNGLGKHWNLRGFLSTGTREYFTGDGYTFIPGEEEDIMTSPTYRSPNLDEI